MLIIRIDRSACLSSGRPPVKWERSACGQISGLSRLALAPGPDPVWTVRARSADANVARSVPSSRAGARAGGRRETWRGGKGFEEGLVSATARQAQDQPDLAERLGIKPGQVVQEIGYAEDCDEALRDAIAQRKDVELVGEDYDDVVDAVLLWWRDGDGDLFDALADALTPLADGGYIWLLTT